MSERIKYCNSYLASITEVGKNFNTIAEVKTKSVLNDFDSIDIPNTTFLVLGPNIIPWGLHFHPAQQVPPSLPAYHPCG